MLLFIAWWLNFFGLITSIVGASLLFFGTPRDTPDIPELPLTSMDLHIYYRDLNLNKEYDKVNQRQKKSKIGFGLVWVGFIFQLVSQLFQYPH